MLLHDKLKEYRLILASQSPRRRQLLADAGIEFVLAPRFECDESFPSTMPADEVAEFFTDPKATEIYARSLHDAIPFTAEFEMELDGEVLGKPKDRAEAVAMLKQLSGREHQVVTGVSLSNALGRRSFSVLSRVKFRMLTIEEIEYYVDNYKPFDKAGSYGIQEWIGYVGIEGIEGSFYNVMGLPVQRVYCELKEFVGLGE